ncbi:MAG: class I SAM-dependent methyltransferase, partial [Chloroflexota bacterium]|nr:class I SAM-dependent methyltransferase [Chloroflexota bacterium]
MTMDANNRYLLQFAARYQSEHPDARFLDFGCGEGKLVRAAVSAGISMVGADVFYETTAERDTRALADFMGKSVFEIVDGRIPFDDETFDVVLNNQVMEHVDDLDGVLREIHRVLKPGGQVLSLFPPRDVWREPHIGIPFSQRFPRDSKSRYIYTRALRTLGIGDTGKSPHDPGAWTR